MEKVIGLFGVLCVLALVSGCHKTERVLAEEGGAGGEATAGADGGEAGSGGSGGEAGSGAYSGGGCGSGGEAPESGGSGGAVGDGGERDGAVSDAASADGDVGEGGEPDGGGADGGGDAGPVCTFGMDQTCNDNPMMSSFRGKCNRDGTCSCYPGVEKNPKTGLCM